MAALTSFPLLDILRQLASEHKSKVYLVGGFLRNVRMGRCGTDLDFAVSCDALGLARVFARRIKGAFVLLDKDHGSARVVKNIDGKAWIFDLTDFRGKTIRDDLSLRDFTVNTFCVDLSNEQDCSLPAAARDLKSKIVRMVSTRAFTDDSLRLLRAFSLSAQTGFPIEAKTLARIKKDAHLINAAAMERTREEVFKILQSPLAFKTLTLLDTIGLLKSILPQITVMYGVHQGGYHHLNVWKHSLEVVRQLEQVWGELSAQEHLRSYMVEEIGGGHTRLALLKLAALLHDIGKPETLKKEKGRMTFHGHEHVGQRITRLAAKRLKLSVKERYFVEDVVRHHLRPGYLSNFKNPSQKAIFRYLRDTKNEAASIAILAMADQRSTRGPMTTVEKASHHDRICRMVLEAYFTKESKPRPVRLLTGHDLIKTLKLTPSPLFAKILNAVQEAQALGKIGSKADALVLAKGMVMGRAV